MDADFNALSKNELKELMNKNWMTHDAMWFYNCFKELGIEKTNKINKAAVHDMAVIEIKRIQKALGVGTIDTFDKFKSFFNAAMEIATGKFMKYKYTFTAKNVMQAQWDSCFAYEGMKMLGVSDRYECGISLRIDTWLNTLGIQYEVDPKVSGCLMHNDGKCVFDYRFFFDQ